MGPVTYRNRGIRATAICLAVFIAMCGALGAWSSTSFAAPIASAIVLLLCVGTIWCVAIRPRVDVDDRGIAVTNPLADRRIRWEHIDDVAIDRGAVAVHTRTGHTIRLWSTLQLATQYGQSPYTDAVAADLRRRLERHRR